MKKKIELTKEQLEKLFQYPPKNIEKETDFQSAYRMGRNSMILELMQQINK